MTLREQFSDALKTSMRAGNSARTSTLRMMLAKVKDADIAARPKGVTAISDDEVLAVLRGMVKSRRESVELYRQGNRPELAAKEEAEIAVIEEFLPQQMDDAALGAAVDKAIAETGAAGMKDMGKVMARAEGGAWGGAGYGPRRAAGPGAPGGAEWPFLPSSSMSCARGRRCRRWSGRRVKLTKSGRNWKGCCPFHNEKSPSFYVYEDGFHCFGCGAHGDAISFVMQTTGAGFPGGGGEPGGGGGAGGAEAVAAGGAGGAAAARAAWRARFGAGGLRAPAARAGGGGRRSPICGAAGCRRRRSRGSAWAGAGMGAAR